MHGEHKKFLTHQIRFGLLVSKEFNKFGTKVTSYLSAHGATTNKKLFRHEQREDLVSLTLLQV